MRNKKTAIIVMVVTYLVLLIVDLVLTLNFGRLVQYLEMNPAYSYVGIAGIIVVNLIIIAVTYFVYKRSRNPTNRFYYINLLVTLCITRILVIFNNIKVLMDPPTLQQAVEFAATTTTVTKTVAVAKFAWLSFIPYFIGIISFWIWSLDHIVIIKKK